MSHGFLVTCFGNLFATQYSREKRVFCTLIVFFKTILKTFKFSLTHCDCSLSCPFISLTNSLCFSQKSTIFFIISSSNFKERYGVFIFLKVFHIYSLWFLGFWVVVEIWKMWCSNMGWVYCDWVCYMGFVDIDNMMLDIHVLMIASHFLVWYLI